GEHERAQPVREARPDEREQAKREGRVRRHSDPPSRSGGAARVEREIDRHGNRHAAKSGEERHEKPPALTQLAQVYFAPRLETYHEEEERHKSAVDPVAERERDAPVAQVDGELGLPQPRVRRAVDVDPDKCSYCGREENGGTSGLRAQELAERRLDAARPRSSRRERGCSSTGHRRLIPSAASTARNGARRVSNSPRRLAPS